jgi:hypothetical protein
LQALTKVQQPVVQQINTRKTVFAQHVHPARHPAAVLRIPAHVQVDLYGHQPNTNAHAPAPNILTAADHASICLQTRPKPQPDLIAMLDTIKMPRVQVAHHVAQTQHPQPVQHHRPHAIAAMVRHGHQQTDVQHRVATHRPHVIRTNT